MWLLKKRQLDEALGQRTVTFSPSGAVMSDRDTRVELPWPRVRSIGEVELMRAVKTPTTSPLSAIGSGVYRPDLLG